jgi:hypothetical protein
MKKEEVGFIAKFFDKSYEGKTILELVNAPVVAISGISEADAKGLEKAFGIKTVKDLATNANVVLSQGVNFFSEAAGVIVDKKFNPEEYKKLASNPVSAIKGISEKDGELLKKAFGIKTIKDLAQNKYVAIAQATVSLAALLLVLRAMYSE